MRTLVCGGRHFADRPFLHLFLDVWHFEHPISVLIHGGAGRRDPKTGLVVDGADLLAGEWARMHQVRVESYPVDHFLDGPWPAAGPQRNTRMLQQGRPDVVIAFPKVGGVRFFGPGTQNMMLQAARARVQIVEALPF